MTLSNTDLVSQAYTNIGKAGKDQAGQDWWVNALNTGTVTPENFQSTFDNAVAETQNQNTKLVQDAYAGIGKAGKDQTGQNWWINQLNSGEVNPTNFQSIFDSSVQDTKRQNDQLVRDAYAKIGRVGVGDGTTNQTTIDPEGYNYWTNLLNSGDLSPEDFNNKFTDATAKSPIERNQVTMFGNDISDLKTGSRSGLPAEYQTKLLDSLIPKLIESIGGFRSDIDNSTRAASDLYRSISKEAMQTHAQGILDDLMSRNIMSGSVASDAMAKGMSDIAKGYADSGMEAAMTGAAMKAQEPTMLGQIAGLGQSSESFNELGPYELLMNSYLNMQ